MILIDNINILKQINPKIWENVRIYEEKENRVISQIEETRKGSKTLVIIKDGKTTYLHSKYDPLKEAETIIESYKDINENSSVIFYGTGLGYHIKILLEKYPNIKYYIYEPIPELLYNFLENINIKNLTRKRLLGISLGIESNWQELSRFIDINQDNLKILELPSHKQNFSNEYKRFSEMLLEIIKNKRSSLITNYSFQKRWIINSMKNFGEVLSTPNIIIEKKNEFKNKTAILVSAGPSLDEEIDNLRYIKENGLAYIFSVGSAINTLIYNGIHPDAATTYDPDVVNQIVFESIKEKMIKEIPIIFGSSVGYETIENYPGKKYHMITSQDSVSNYYLKDEGGKNVSIVQDAPTIAVITLQLLYELGFSHIILVGQNLAYRGNLQHAEGIYYIEHTTEDQIEKGIKVKDVYGNEILTTEGYNSMRNQMELYIKQFSDIKVTNTTKQGANIEGAKFVELIEVIRKDLKNKVVQQNWLDGNKTFYNKQYLQMKLRDMDKAYENSLKINREYSIVLNRIKRLIDKRNFLQAEKMYIKLDKELKKIEKNDYFKTFILPMNRVQYKILADSINSLNCISDPYLKGEKIVESFKNFINICTADMEMINSIYMEMNIAIREYYS